MNKPKLPEQGMAGRIFAVPNTWNNKILNNCQSIYERSAAGRDIRIFPLQTFCFRQRVSGGLHCQNSFWIRYLYISWLRLCQLSQMDAAISSDGTDMVISTRLIPRSLATRWASNSPEVDL